MKNLLKLLAFALIIIFNSCAEDNLENITEQENAKVNSASLSSKVNTVFQAEDYDAQSGIQVSGGWKVGWVNNGDWIRFEDFDHSGATSITVTASSSTNGGAIEFRKGSATGGNLLATVNVSGTGGWNNMQEFTANITGSSSNSDLYVVFTGGSGYLLDLDSFEFTSGTTNSSGTRFADMVGKTVRLENTQTDDWLRITSAADYADCEMVSQNNTGNWPRWVVEEVNDGGNYYYRFKNVASDRRFRPETSGDNQNINLGKTTWTGNWTQWEITSSSNGEYVLKNRSTGTYLSAASATNGTIAKSVTNQNSYTTWRIEDLNGDDANGSGNSGGGGSSGSDTPSDILPDLQYFKLTFPLDSNGDDNRNISWSNLSDDYKSAYEEDNLVGYDASSPYSNYFFGDGDEVVFRAHCAGALTSSGSYPRCELRETPNGGDDLWEFADEHVLEATFRVTHLPNEKQEVCILQIKGNDSNNTSGTEEAFRLEYRQDGSQGMHAVINEGSTENDIMDYSLGDTVESRMYVNNGNVSITLNNISNGDSWVRNYSSNYSHGYFKAGCYTQSSIYSEKNGVADEEPDAYGEVRFSELNVTGTNN